MYKIILYRRAVGFYNRLTERKKNRLSKAIKRLKDNPLYGRDIKRLKGKLRGKYRLRVGSFRVVYLIDEKRKVVVIESIGPRGDIY